MARLHCELLGGFAARLAGGQPCSLPTRKAQALLAYLALPAGRFQSREKLTALLWGNTTEAQTGAGRAAAGAHRWRRGAAVQQYQVCLGWLQRELGVEPEEETRQFYREILRSLGGERTGAGGAPASVAPAAGAPMIGRGAENDHLRAALARMLEARGAGRARRGEPNEEFERFRRDGGAVIPGIHKACWVREGLFSARRVPSPRSAVVVDAGVPVDRVAAAPAAPPASPDCRSGP